jgi:hypothetical protein
MPQSTTTDDLNLSMLSRLSVDAFNIDNSESHGISHMPQLPTTDDPNSSMISGLSDDYYDIDSSVSGDGVSRMEWITDDNESSAVPNQCRFVRPPTMPRRLKSITFRSAALNASPRAAAKNMDPPILAPQLLESISTFTASTITISSPLPETVQPMESSSICSASKSISVLPRAGAADLPTDRFLPGVSPPSKPQRLLSVGHTAPTSLSCCSESSEESIPVHDEKLPPSIPQRRGTLIL